MPGNEPNPSEGGKSLGGWPSEAGGTLKCRYLSYAPPAYECGTKPFLRWVLSQGRSPKRQAVPKMPQCRFLSYAPPAYECGTRWVLSQGGSPTQKAVPKLSRTPSAFPFSGRLRRRAINPTPPKRVKAWGDGPLTKHLLYKSGTAPRCRVCVNRKL